jgi:hypothetical protein
MLRQMAILILSRYVEYLEIKHPDLLPKLAERKEIDEEIEKEMIGAVESFLKGFKQEAN